MVLLTLPLGACRSRPSPIPAPPQTRAPAGPELAAQITPCWYLDPGKELPSDAIVEIRAELMSDGTVQSAEIVDKARMTRDADYRATAEAVRRAILRCSPFHLPVNKYETWKSILFRVDPLGMPG